MLTFEVASQLQIVFHTGWGGLMKEEDKKTHLFDMSTIKHVSAIMFITWKRVNIIIFNNSFFRVIFFNIIFFESVFSSIIMEINITKYEPQSFEHLHPQYYEIH